jgi:hypothetical protein
VPTKIVPSFVTTIELAFILGKVLLFVQLTPPSVERYTAPEVMNPVPRSNIPVDVLAMH